MDAVLKNLNVFQNGVFIKGSVAVKDGLIAGVSADGASGGLFLLPGFTDVHVHLREPGFSYKETIRTGTLAAARGGYTSLCAMPNLSPVPDCPENLRPQSEIIKRDAAVDVYPYGSLTRGEKGTELSDMEGLSPLVCGFSDDGRGVQNGDMMRAAMIKAKSLGKIIAAHCEDESLLKKGWSVNESAYARERGLIGNPAESEWRQVERDLALAEETGCAYHVCHVSCWESVDLIRRAKARGADVTCETAPHYLLLDDTMLRDEGGFRMNPPIRSPEDRAALLLGVEDGTVDMIATDHAPHSAEEKSGGLAGSLNGIVGLETAFPALYTGLVKTGLISLEKLMALLHGNAKKRFSVGTDVAPGEPASFTVFDLSERYRIDPAEFLSMGRSTPFAHREVYGRCLLTVCRGETVWRDPRYAEGLE